MLNLAFQGMPDLRSVGIPFYSLRCVMLRDNTPYSILTNQIAQLYLVNTYLDPHVSLNWNTYRSQKTA